MDKNQKRIEGVYDYYFNLVQPVLKNISLKVVNQVMDPSKTPVIDEFSNSKAFINVLVEIITTGHLYGELTHKEEIEYQMLKYKKDFADEQWQNGFAGAKEFFIKKRVVTADVFNDLSREAKELSFTVANLTDLTVSGHIKDLITTAIDSGMDLETYQKQVAEMVKVAGITPLKPWYIENVFRTNLFSTYNIGRRKAGIEDDNTEGWQYVAVGDSRTREDHAANNGITAKKNDPIWNSIYPPIDYMCRCSTIAISGFYAKTKGIKFGNYNKANAIKSVGKNFRDNGSSPKSLNEYNIILKKELK